jgi:hypothetical protein
MEIAWLPEHAAVACNARASSRKRHGNIRKRTSTVACAQHQLRQSLTARSNSGGAAQSRTMVLLSCRSETDAKGDCSVDPNRRPQPCTVLAMRRPVEDSADASMIRSRAALAAVASRVIAALQGLGVFTKESRVFKHRAPPSGSLDRNSVGRGELLAQCRSTVATDWVIFRLGLRCTH